MLRLRLATGKQPKEQQHHRLTKNRYWRFSNCVWLCAYRLLSTLRIFAHYIASIRIFIGSIGGDKGIWLTQDFCIFICIANDFIITITIQYFHQHFTKISTVSTQFLFLSLSRCLIRIRIFFISIQYLLWYNTITTPLTKYKRKDFKIFLGKKATKESTVRVCVCVCMSIGIFD